MEGLHGRKLRSVNMHDQENVYATKGKINLVAPLKKSGLSVRGAFGELNANVQVQRENGKVAIATAEFEKKATTTTRVVVKSNSYKHVQSKIDTGLPVRNTVQSRPPLRREESTGMLAIRAVRSQAALKDTTNKLSDLNEAAQGVKINVAIKKSSKLPTVKENVKEVKNKLKPILKESTESLEKLKLVENSRKSSVDSQKSSAAKSSVAKSSVANKEQEIVEHALLSSPKLPADIKDIDASDQKIPLQMSTYVKDIYKYLLFLEEKYPIEVDHLKNQKEITGNMRATLIDWLVEVQHQFDLLLETLHLTVGIIDRYLQVTPNVRRNQLQLVGVTALFLASKYEEIYVHPVEDFVHVTDNAYTVAEVFQCEREILYKLEFSLSRPIPLSFLRRFVKATDGTSKNHHLAKYFVDLCLVEYSMAHYRPSELATAAICLSLYLLSNKSIDRIFTPTFSYYTGYTLDHINPIIRKIAQIIVNAPKSRLQAINNKYLDPSLARVSSLPQLKSDLIYNLANNSSF